MKKLLRPLIGVIVLTVVPATALAEPGDLQRDIRNWREAHEQAVVDGLVELLRIPNVASDKANILRNANHLLQQFDKRGFDTRLLTSDGPPAVFAERRAPGAERTLLIYIHYDGQPANPADWASDPWRPVMRDALVEAGGEIVPVDAPFNPEWRLFGRSASDDKAPIIALLAALDALESLGKSLSVNLKVFLEGEEEAGSPNLSEVLTANRDLLNADLWLFCDGPMHQSRRLQLVYGVRGTYGFDITVHGPNRPLHSGHYGNWAPNPIVQLMALLQSMRDENGNILVKGYADEVVAPSEAELNAIAAAPPVDALLIGQLGFGEPETDERIELAILRPAINFRGIRSGDVGEDARNAIQVAATASVGLRLVPAQTREHLRETVESHIRAQGYEIVQEPPTDDQRQRFGKIAEVHWANHGYPAYRAPLDLPIARKVASILDELRVEPLIRMPSMGGSLPIYLIDEIIGAPVVILPIANHDNNQHGKDENIRLQNLWDAIEIYASVLTGF